MVEEEEQGAKNDEIEKGQNAKKKVEKVATKKVNCNMPRTS